MKPALAAILTASILAAMIWAGSRSTVPAAGPQVIGPEEVDDPPNPAEQAVRDLIRSGDAGDVPAYLDAFAEPLRSRVGREVADKGRAAFADDLRRASGARKGHAVHAAEPEGPDSARVVVESIYPDRNERRTYRVVKIDEAWKVADVAIVRAREPSAKFGSPANVLMPEPGRPEGPAPPDVGLTVEDGDDDPE